MDTEKVRVRDTMKTSIIRTVIAISLGILFFFTISFITYLVYLNQYEGRILPGISIASIDVSGLTIEEASTKLNNELNYPVSGRLTLRDDDRAWSVVPIQLGLLINTPESIHQAYQTGRSGGIVAVIKTQYQSYINGNNLPAIVMFDERVSFGYLQKISNEIDSPIIEAELYLDGSSVYSSNGKSGRLIDIEASLENISKKIYTFSDGDMELIVEEIQPSILDVEPQANLLRELLNSPKELMLPDQTENDSGPWLMNTDVVASIIKIDKVYQDGSAKYVLGTYDSPVYALLELIEQEVERSPQNAKFIFNDETRRLDLIKSAVIGRKLNIEGSMQIIKNDFFNGSGEITLATDIELPQVGNDITAQDLGITELVSTGITYFWGSTAERIQNIKTASEKFHGILIAPGETFSMGSTLGDVSLENGYAEALIIYGDRTITGVGGGVCQVSTTLFRTVFFGGYPVVERYPHAYRVGYYEQIYSGAKDNSLAGLDATVYVPLVDFKFTNDSQFWILMETYVNEYDHRLTWKFYSTNDGRSVVWNTTGPQNIEDAPDPLFVENPELGKLEMKQVDWSADGADVTITRTVYKGGVIYLSDEFKTSYKPWRAICQYGVDVSDPEAKASDLGICQ